MEAAASTVTGSQVLYLLISPWSLTNLIVVVTGFCHIDFI